MAILEQLNRYMDTVLLLTVVLLLAISGVYIYLFRIRKITAKEEKVNYNLFRREDSVNFIPFQNIISDESEEEPMGVVDLGNHTYVGGIGIIGYNFESATLEEQQRTMLQTERFINIIDSPMQFRQSVRAVDVAEDIELYESRKCELECTLAELADSYNTIVDDIKVCDKEDLVRLQKRMEEADRLKEKIEATQWLIKECNLMLAFLSVHSDRDVDAEKVNQLFFTYHFKASDYTEELSEEGISQKACRELRTSGRALADALSSCGCRTYLLSLEDITGLLKSHVSPFGADDFMVALRNSSSYQALFVTSSVKEGPYNEGNRNE